MAVSATATSPAASAMAASNPQPTFLVIDDDPVHRMVIGKVGDKAGYAITAVASADDAICKAQAAEIRLHLARSVARRNRWRAHCSTTLPQHNSEAMLIVISGASAATREDTLVHALKLRLNVVEAPKPVDLADLRGKLQLHAAVTKAVAAGQRPNPEIPKPCYAAGSVLKARSTSSRASLKQASSTLDEVAVFVRRDRYARYIRASSRDRSPAAARMCPTRLSACAPHP